MKSKNYQSKRLSLHNHKFQYVENNSNKNDQKDNKFKDLLMKNEDRVDKNETITDGNLEENILKQINKLLSLI